MMPAARAGDRTAAAAQLTIAEPAWPGPGEVARRLRLLAHYERDRMPWARLQLSVLLARRGAYARRPLHGNALRLLRSGRLEIGRGTVLESGVTIHADRGRIRLGSRVYLSRGVSVGAVDLVEIGDCALVGPGCYITDGDHRHDDLTLPVPDQGMSSKGPVIIEDNVWLGANVVITSGVRIGRRAVIGANSVVTRDIPAFAVAAGSPAQVVSSVRRQPD